MLFAHALYDIEIEIVCVAGLIDFFKRTIAALAPLFIYSELPKHDLVHECFPYQTGYMCCLDFKVFLCRIDL